MRNQCLSLLFIIWLVNSVVAFFFAVFVHLFCSLLCPHLLCLFKSRLVETEVTDLFWKVSLAAFILMFVFLVLTLPFEFMKQKFYCKIWCHCFCFVLLSCILITLQLIRYTIVLQLKKKTLLKVTFPLKHHTWHMTFIGVCVLLLQNICWTTSRLVRAMWV